MRELVDAALPKEHVAEVVGTALDMRLAQIRAQQTSRPGLPNIVPDEVRGSDLRVLADRSVDGEGVWAATYQLLDAYTGRDFPEVAKVQNRLARAGHFGVDKQKEARAIDPEVSRAIMLTSAEGTPFLPTTVLNVIEDVMKIYGVARQLCTVVQNIVGQVKVPRISGRLVAYAVSEAGTILARKANFGSNTLDPDKWGVIIPFTREMEIEVGAQLTAVIMTLAGEAFALAEDQTVFTADGTSTYHSLTGLLESGTVGEHVMASGSTSFSDTTFDDLIDMRTQVDPGARGMQSAYVFHPDMEDVFAKQQDGQGRYIFGDGRAFQPIDRIGGRRVRYTEALPSLSDDAVSTSFGTFGDYRFVTIGFQRDLTARLLTEGTILDPADDTTPIRLGASDAMALRLVAAWDVVYGLVNAFSKVTTAAS